LTTVLIAAAHFNGRVVERREPRQGQCRVKSAECRVKNSTKATALTAENAEDAWARNGNGRYFELET
jgi:hypothetical protein